MKKASWFVLILLTACTSKLIAPAMDVQKMQNKVPSMTIERANKGHNLYVQYCGSCHHLYEPGKFTEKKWGSVLAKMLPKSKVTDPTDQQLITDYLISLSK